MGLVCASIERGETSVIFRKGGIAEGSQGFQFKHSRFFLFPTYFHEQIERTRLSRERDVSAGNDGVTISRFCGDRVCHIVARFERSPGVGTSFTSCNQQSWRNAFTTINKKVCTLLFCGPFEFLPSGSCHFILRTADAVPGSLYLILLLI